MENCGWGIGRFDEDCKVIPKKYFVSTSLVDAWDILKRLSQNLLDIVGKKKFSAPLENHERRAKRRSQFYWALQSRQGCEHGKCSRLIAPLMA